MLRGLVAALGLSAGAAAAQDITSARYEGPTTRYAHGVLGDAIEHGELVLRLASGKAKRLILPENRVFEDVAPRLFDVDGDGAREVIVVESHANRGARLAIYDGDGLVTATPYIGQRNRWLAPAGVGAADLDGDGAVELAYVDRPHLAKTLRIWRFASGKLVPVGEYPGVTNHRIGERDIAGGIRDCGQGPEVVVADAGWQNVLAVRFDGEGFSARTLGAHRGRNSFARAMACE
ncbi:MAG: VCBS repeat-containing protein [Silicimonas sp.]|nr:VCBS repeat-containing protein [Silicimonas sp.]